MSLFLIRHVNGTITASVAKRFGVNIDNIHVIGDTLHKNPVNLRKNKEPFVILGHTQRDEAKKSITVDELTPRQMAQEFADRVVLEDREVLTDIYFLSCEVGWRINGGYCYAEEFADELYLLGFKKATIHAISPEKFPDNCTGMQLLVTLESNPNHINYGHVRAIYVTKEYERLQQEYDSLVGQRNNLGIHNRISQDLNNKIDATKAQMRKLEENELQIVENTNIKEDLDKKKYCFRSRHYIEDLKQEAKDLEQETIVKQYYKITSAFHLFSVRSENYELKGEHLKFKILTEFYKQLVTKQTQQEVLNYVKEISNHNDYKILGQNQGVFTRMFSMFGSNTRSIKALNQMVEDKLSSFKTPK